MFVFIKNTIPWKICILNPNSSWVICPWSLKFLKNYANFQYILLFLNVCKQTFVTSHVRISQQVKSVLMWNLQHIIFISRQIYWQIFKSAFSVPFKDQDQCLITVVQNTKYSHKIKKIYSEQNKWEVRDPSKSAPLSGVFQQIIKITNIVDSLEKNCV